MPDRELDDLWEGIIDRHGKLEARVNDLELLEHPDLQPDYHLQLSQLRGYWPMSSVDENGDPYDLSGQGRVLTNNNAIPFGVYRLLPYANLTPGSTHYFSRPDEAGLDITGALTVGGWFWLDTLASGTNQILMSKWTTAGNQKAFILYFSDASDTLNFIITTDGSTNVAVTSTIMPVISTWYHIVGRFIPSSELSIFVDGIETLNAAGIPATIFNSNAGFEIGASDAGNNRLDGRASQCFLCADDLDDIVIKNIFNRTRTNFGK